MGFFDYCSRHLDGLPFVRIFVPFAAGVLVSDRLVMPADGVIPLVLAALLSTRLVRRGAYFSVAIALALFLCGGMLGELGKPVREIPRGHKLFLSLRVTGQPDTTAGGKLRLTGRAQWYWTGNADTIPCSEKVLVYADTSYRIPPGSEIVLHSYINDIANFGDTTRFDYATFYRRRGVIAVAYASRHNRIVSVKPLKQTDFTAAATTIRNKMTRIFIDSGMSAGQSGVIAAMIAGDRSHIPPDTNAAYSDTGIAHILAISGLHIGVIAVLLNIALFWLMWFRRGRVVKTVLVIIVLWVYAWITGISAPVCRAVLMFSFLQVGYLSASETVSMNLLFASAFILLAADPSNLFSVSFQMSYMAVFAILLCLPLIRSLWRPRQAALRWLWDGTAVSAAAQIGVLPLIAFYFGKIPLLTLALNPFVALLLLPLMLAGFLFLFAHAAPVLSTVLLKPLEWMLTAVNSTIEYTAALPFASLKLDVNGCMVWGYYLAMVAAAAAIGCKKEKKSAAQGFE